MANENDKYLIGEFTNQMIDLKSKIETILYDQKEIKSLLANQKNISADVIPGEIKNQLQESGLTKAIVNLLDKKPELVLGFVEKLSDKFGDSIKKLLNFI